MKTIKKLLFLIFAGIVTVSCKSNDDHIGDWAVANGSDYPGAAVSGAVSFTVKEKTYVGLGFDERAVEKNDFYVFSGPDNGFQPIANFPGEPRMGAVAFADDNYGYVGLGYTENNGSGNKETKYLRDFWRYDPGTNSWSQIAEYPVPGLRHAIGFSLKGKGYVGTGADKSNALSGEIYMYDPQTDTWTTNFLRNIDARVGAVAWVLGDDAYIALGKSGGTDVNSVWKFTPDGTGAGSGGKWEELDKLRDTKDRTWDNDYPKIKRAYAVAFVIGTGQDARAYIAGGDNMNYTTWQFNPHDEAKGRWYEMTPFPMQGGFRNYAIGFSHKEHGYITTGGNSIDGGTTNYKTTYSFNPYVKDDDQNDD